jgi:DNA-binding CsgD family transcriptional regulator
MKAHFPFKELSPVLTRREREVLQLLVEGATNRMIAQKLSVSIETVKSHVHHIMQKMQVKDRTQAAVAVGIKIWLKLGYKFLSLSSSIEGEVNSFIRRLPIDMNSHERA